MVTTDITDKIVPLPLHVLLGLVNDVVSKIERECIQNDTLIKQKKGGVNIIELKTNYDNMNQSQRTIETCQLNIKQLQQQISEIEERMLRYKQQNKKSMEYKDGRPKYFDKQSLIERQPYMEMKAKQQQHGIDVRHWKKIIKEQQQKLAELQEQLVALPGPFMVHFNQVLTSLKITRSDYHGRALIGTSM